LSWRLLLVPGTGLPAAEGGAGNTGIPVLPRSGQGIKSRHAERRAWRGRTGHRRVLPVSRIAGQSSRNIISGTISGKIIPRMTPVRSFSRITGYRTVFFSVDVHGRRLPLPEETGSFRMPGFADAGEAAMTAAAFQAGGKEVNMEAGVFRTGFRHPPASRLRRL